MKRTAQTVAPPIEIPREIEPADAMLELEEKARRPSDESTEWLWLLWERRRLVRKAALWGLIMSTLAAFVIPKRFQSTTRLMPPDSQSGSGMAMMAALAGSGGSGLGALAGDLLGMKSSGALFVDILSGRTVEDRIIDRFDLRRAYRDKYWEDARKDLAKRTALSEDRKSGVITIVVTDHDPHRAAAIAEAYVDELDRLVAQVSTSSARRERVFIEQRLQTVKHDLDTASEQFSEYASKNTAIDIGEQGKAMIEAAARLEGELIAAQSELEGVEQIYSPSHIRVRSLRARVDELKQQLNKFSGLDSELNASDPTNSNSDGSAGNSSAFPTIRQLPLLGVRWADLYRQTKIQEKVFELLTQQYELAKIQEAKEIPVVKVLDAPDVPEKKSFPPRLAIIVVGMLLAMGATAVSILSREAWNQVDPLDRRKQLGEEILARLKRGYERTKTFKRSKDCRRAAATES
jgi:capsule polysaccharide export protein KpsE/RkpR